MIEEEKEDLDIPYCSFDTTRCDDCGFCEISPLELYLKQKEEKSEVRKV